MECHNIDMFMLFRGKGKKDTRTKEEFEKEGKGQLARIAREKCKN